MQATVNTTLIFKIGNETTRGRELRPDLDTYQSRNLQAIECDLSDFGEDEIVVLEETITQMLMPGQGITILSLDITCINETDSKLTVDFTMVVQEECASDCTSEQNNNTALVDELVENLNSEIVNGDFTEVLLDNLQCNVTSNNETSTCDTFRDAKIVDIEVTEVEIEVVQSSSQPSSQPSSSSLPSSSMQPSLYPSLSLQPSKSGQPTVSDLNHV